MTGERPYVHIKRNAEVVVRMLKGERPRRPEGSIYTERGLDDSLWHLLQRCWRAEPAERPSIQEALDALPAP